MRSAIIPVVAALLPGILGSSCGEPRTRTVTVTNLVDAVESSTTLLTSVRALSSEVVVAAAADVTSASTSTTKTKKSSSKTKTKTTKTKTTKTSSTTAAVSSQAAVESSSAAAETATATADPDAAVTTAATTKASSSAAKASAAKVSVASSQTAAETTAATSAATFAATTAAAAAATATAAAGVGATIITSLAGGSGVGGTTCTVTALADVTASAAACSNILLDGLTIPASSTLSVTVPTSGALLFAGTMTVEYTPDADYTPIVLKGSYAKVAGLAGAVIDGQGAQYWDGEGSNGGTAKPDHFIKLGDMVSSSFGDITIQNWPTHLFEITGCTDMTMTNLILDNSAGNALDSDGDALGHNTDAFDVSSTDGLYVSGATVYNQDDCVAVNSGSDMVFENLYCDGGHGLSIGSVKSDVTISNITFRDSSVIDSANGCRIKTVADATDSTVTDITYSNIYLSGITTYAIDVQQDYENGGPTGDPSTGVTVSGVTFKDITGTTSGDDAYEYYVLCGSSSSCTDFTWTGIDITGGGQTECSPSGSICPS